MSFVFNVPPTAKVIMETEPWLSLIRQTGGARDQTQNLWVQGDWLITYEMNMSVRISVKGKKPATLNNFHFLLHILIIFGRVI